MYSELGLNARQLEMWKQLTSAFIDAYGRCDVCDDPEDCQCSTKKQAERKEKALNDVRAKIKVECGLDSYTFKNPEDQIKLKKIVTQAIQDFLSSCEHDYGTGFNVNFVYLHLESFYLDFEEYFTDYEYHFAIFPFDKLNINVYFTNHMTLAKACKDGLESAQYFYYLFYALPRELINELVAKLQIKNGGQTSDGMHFTIGSKEIRFAEQSYAKRAGYIKHDYEFVIDEDMDAEKLRKVFWQTFKNSTAADFGISDDAGDEIRG